VKSSLDDDKSSRGAKFGEQTGLIG
jgi:hypothetical protein